MVLLCDYLLKVMRNNMTKSKIKWKWIILVTIIFFIFSSLAFPQMTKYSNEMIGESNSPDESFIYSPSELYDMAESYGELGREAYIKIRWTFDLVWPICYTLFLISWIAKLSDYISDKRRLRFAYIFPLASIIFDYMENIGATIVMARYPLKSGIIATITPVISFIKWVSVAGSVLILIILIISLILAKFKRAKPES